MYYNNINMMSNHGVANSIFNKSDFAATMKRVSYDYKLVPIEIRSKYISQLSLMPLYELNVFKKGRFKFIRNITCRDEINSAMCIEDLTLELESATQEGIYAYYSVNNVRYED